VVKLVDLALLLKLFFLGILERKTTVVEGFHEILSATLPPALLLFGPLFLQFLQVLR
jgi:hypothetical protein